MLKKLLVASLAAVLILFCYPAFAQEAPSGGVIDFAPILNELMLAVAMVLSAGLMYLAKMARDWFKAKTGVELQISEEKMREYIDKAIQYGIALVLPKVSGKAKITVGNEQVAQIANYVIAAVPDAIKAFGITPERLQDMIRARLNAWTDGPAAAVEPTPTVPSAPVVAVPPAAPAA